MLLFCCSVDKSFPTLLWPKRQPTPVFNAWKIPWTEEPGGLQSMGLQRVRHNWATSVCVCVDCSLPGSSVREISQARILKWVAISFSRGSSRSRDWARISCITDRFFTTEPLGKPGSLFTDLWFQPQIFGTHPVNLQWTTTIHYQN